MSRSYAAALAVVAFAILPGCATITSNEMQTVSLTAKGQDGNTVDQVSCVLKNDKGQWQATAPAQVAVRRSADDLTVLCKKDGQPDGLLRAISRAAAGMFGNIIFGGGIGAIIDHSKGTGYNYPDSLPVKLGENVTIDRREPSPAEAQKQAQAEAK